MSKDKYRVRNWRQYNEGLKKRGAVTLWLNTEALQPPAPSLHRGRPQRYSNAFILACLTVRQVYHLPLRACAGFLQSLRQLLPPQSAIPDYTTMCRRAATLQVDLAPLQQKGCCDVAIDATGLKVYGEGEWKVRRHGYTKRRTWMKLHVVVNTQSQQVEAVALTPNSVDDATLAAPLVEDVCRQHPIHRLLGDGAYDKVKVWRPLQGRCIRLIFPPSQRAVKNKETAPWQAARNEQLRRIEEQGRAVWKHRSGYHRRSVVETFMLRYKTMIGGRMRSRTEARQRTEARLSCRLLNELLQLAKPQSQKVD